MGVGVASFVVVLVAGVVAVAVGEGAAVVGEIGLCVGVLLAACELLLPLLVL